MEQYIKKSALVAELNRKKIPFKRDVEDGNYPTYLCTIMDFEDYINSIEVKEVDIDKLCEFRKNIGFAYPEGAREYQKQLACYRQGIEDAIKAQKGE